MEQQAKSMVKALGRELRTLDYIRRHSVPTWDEGDHGAELRWNQADRLWMAAHVYLDRHEWGKAFDLAKDGHTILEGN
jgi:hypothetical protein